jgi:hypothetical protein
LYGFIAAFVDCCSYLYQIAHLGDDDDEPEFSSAMPLEEGDTFFFAPRPLRNLVLVDELDSLSPILACQVADLGKCNFECWLLMLRSATLTSEEMMNQLWSVFMNSAGIILKALTSLKLI